MDKHELESMTKDELIEYADDNDIEVHHNWLKDDIISHILKAEKKAAKEETKTEHGPPTKGMPTAKPQEVDPETGVSPELAELQRQTNEPPKT